MLLLATVVFLLFLFFLIIIVFCLIKLLELYIRSLQLENIRSRYVLITGCDSGFGNLLARNLDRIGVPVFATCLTEQGMTQLHETCSSRLRAFPMDVTNEEDIQKAVQFVHDNMEPGGSM